jgi:dimethylaniline monooxygenase (N-oxide forming)
MRICVIGAGSSGIVCAKYLLAEGYEVAVYEQSESIGGTFVNKRYDDAHLVSSKYITPFSDLRLPKTTGPHQSLEDYTTYLEEYSSKFDVDKVISFKTTVQRVSKMSDGTYTVQVVDAAGTHDEVFGAIAVCSGLHNHPFVPEVEGIKSFTGTTLHSSEYKDKSIFKDKSVIVVGCGETAMDIAYRAVQVAKSTAMSIRNGFLSVPTVYGQLPLDTLIGNMFEHCYEQKWVHHYRLRWKFTTLFIRGGFFLTTGSSRGFNQWAGGLKEVKRGYHIINKSTKAMAYINKPLKDKHWAGWLYKWWDGPTLPGKFITTHKGIAKVEGSTVHFTDGSPPKTGVDMIVYATGYTQRFPFMHGGASEPKKHAAVSGQMAGDRLPTEHHITNPYEPEIGYIGFVRPNVGAIPPMAELQTMWWIQRLQGKIKGPKKPPTYHVLARKFEYGVDYGNYMHEVAGTVLTIHCTPYALHYSIHKVPYSPCTVPTMQRISALRRTS